MYIFSSIFVYNYLVHGIAKCKGHYFIQNT